MLPLVKCSEMGSVTSQSQTILDMKTRYIHPPSCFGFPVPPDVHSHAHGPRAISMVSPTRDARDDAAGGASVSPRVAVLPWEDTGESFLLRSSIL